MSISAASAGGARGGAPAGGTAPVPAGGSTPASGRVAASVPSAAAVPASAPIATPDRAGAAFAPASAEASPAPVVSLLMPICNVERYLEESISSACAQTLRDIEIICIDDGSTDSSSQIIARAAARDPRIRVITKPNSGYGDSMNRGLDAARGTYIGILESDDVMYPDALERLVRAAEEVRAPMAKGNFDLYWSTPQERREFFEVVPASRCGAPSCPREDPFIFQGKPSIWSGVYRRDFLARNGIRFLPTPGAAFQDTSFSFKAFACADRVAYVHEAVLAYRQDNEGSSVNASNKVYCVCEEYAEIERWLAGAFAERFGADAAARMLRCALVAKYDSYMWSYVRLAPRFHVEFLERMAAEYRASITAGAFELDDLKPWKRANLVGILRDPAAWEQANASYAKAGPAGRALHYLKLGGPGLLLSYAKSRLIHE